jgi:RNA polymerase sigma-70 factor (sigma-E family)
VLQFDEFCGRLHPRLVGAMTLYCGDPAAAEDFAQEALARAFKDWEKVSRLDSPDAWVFRVAMNLAHSWYRRSRHREEAAPVSMAAVPPEDALALRQAVNGLPRRQRQAVVLRFYLDWSVAQTAAALGIADGTVRALTAQAVKTLQTTLGREWKDGVDE